MSKNRATGKMFNKRDGASHQPRRWRQERRLRRREAAGAGCVLVHDGGLMLLIS